jgi:glycosyltransferase involved in cell wall biosynthesis
MLKEKASGNPDIIFTGFISGDVLTEIYSNAYVVTLPSDIEGMSLSLLEALAYGNAVLCSDIPENTLVTENKAMHFKKSDVDDLAEKLQAMCDDERIVNPLKDGADEFILSKYNWDDVANSTYELYKKVLKKQKKGI